jgi:YYY domain-containing protein
MTAFLTWYFLLTLLGWLTFPLTFALFPALTDRGYTLARTAGLLIWAYVFWLFASLGIAQNDLGGIILALAILIALSIWSLVTHYSSLVTFLKNNLPLLLTTELLFLAAFGFMAFVRSANPELNGTERPMELAFINGILRSPTFPPQDPWLSGYAISYYYFGYVMTAMLAKLAFINGSTAHNLMTALIFGLGAIGSYGILYNLLDRGRQTADRSAQLVSRNSYLVTLPLLAPLFLLLISNLAALLEVLHRRGIGWTKDPVTGQWTSAFWTWLDMKELSFPPVEPLTWIPDRYLWWWRASRVIQDYDMLGSHREVIDEFPFFSFLLGDLHPHVLAIPFGLLAVSVALNLFLGGWRGSIDIFGARLHLDPKGFFFSALVLGGLAFLNTWDILVAAALIVSAFIFYRAREDGWNWSRLEDLILLALPLGIFSLLLYFPFHLGFSSQAGGILPNFMYPTRGVHLWVMWGTLFIPIFAFLIYFGVSQRAGGRSELLHSKPNWKLGILLSLAITFSLSLLTFLTGWLGSIIEKPFVDGFLASQNMTAAQYLAATSLRRLDHIGSLITLLAILIPTLAFLFSSEEKREISNEEQVTSNEPHPSSLITSQPTSHFPLFTSHSSLPTSHFPLLLLTFATLLVLAPEFVYLRDQFGYRINTVFKFYYQAWILFSLVASFGVATLLQNLSFKANVAFRITIGLVIFAGLLYPAFGLLTKTNNFKPTFGFNLNDFDRFQRENPDDAAAIQFLLTAPDGIVAEAIGDGYSAYGRVSMYTGLQTVLGWPGHEAQWRGSYALQGTRREDITRLYTTARWEEAQTIIQQYNIRYIYIGTLERLSMRVNEAKFSPFLTPIFQEGNVVIYEVP